MGRKEVLGKLEGKPEAERVSLDKILKALDLIDWIEQIAVTKSHGLLDHQAVDLIIYLDKDVTDLLGFETVCVQAKSGNGGGYSFVNQAMSNEGRLTDTRLMPLVLLVTNDQTSELIVSQLLLQLAWAGSWFRNRKISAEEILDKLSSSSPIPLTTDIPGAIWKMEQVWDDNKIRKEGNNENGGKKKNRQGKKGKKKNKRVLPRYGH